MPLGAADEMDEFRAAKLARKKRTKWWREHIVLAYAVAIGISVVSLVAMLAIFELPAELKALGVSPSVVKLVAGTMWCGLGVWLIRANRDSSLIAAYCP